MNRPVPLLPGETYHIYNRGAHKGEVFRAAEDYRRFLMLMYIANSFQPVNLRDLLERHKGLTFGELLSVRANTHDLVEVLAYSLLPNHFHLVLRQKTDQGVSRFLQKICTAYCMYFNLKYDHRGTMFQGRFKSSHIHTDSYMQWIFPYVHLNAISIDEPGWKEKGVSDPARAAQFLKNYPYSSYRDYYGAERLERAVLAYREATELVERERDVIGLLNDYSRGRILFNNEQW